MKRKYLWLSALSIALLALIALAGYFFMSTGKSHSTDLNELHARFNQDRGKVRLLMLLSPT